MLTARGHIESIDTEYSIRTAKAILEEGTMPIDPVSPGADHTTTPDGGLLRYMPGLELVCSPFLYRSSA